MIVFYKMGIHCQHTIPQLLVVKIMKHRCKISCDVCGFISICQFTSEKQPCKQRHSVLTRIQIINHFQLARPAALLTVHNKQRRPHYGRLPITNVTDAYCRMDFLKAACWNVNGKCEVKKNNNKINRFGSAHPFEDWVCRGHWMHRHPCQHTAGGFGNNS